MKMKKTAVILILLSIMGAVVITAHSRKSQFISVFKDRKSEISQNDMNFQTAENDGHNGKEEDKMENIRIKLIFNKGEIIVRMNDNQATKDLINMLPLKLDFSDYAGTEKISYLPEKLSERGAPQGSKPSVGSFTYYSPWGNLAVFYKDFQYSNNLIILGEIESGLEYLKDLEGEVRIEIL
jgi:hypothetical protein